MAAGRRQRAYGRVRPCEVIMYRAFALLALPLLVAGCGSASKSTRSDPPPTIDSYRTSYFSGKPLPDPEPERTQVASMPGADHPGADRSGGDQGADQAAPAPRSAGPQPYRASVAAYIKRYAVNSNSLKLAKIGTPFQGSVNGQKGPVVCVELGATGSRTAYLLKDNSVADSEFGAPACHDKKLQPWDNPGA
ncbi:MAG TPA: hypothetical protein VG328_00390 [Stellaceae bacterium]|jgi:hypothetical protein|nr:hypothetical protein [Stellaceae bacterium]